MEIDLDVVAGGGMRFDYLQPSTIGECVALLGSLGKDAKIIAGGTDLMIQTRARSVDPRYVIDVTGIPDLCSIRENDDGGLRIGAAVTVRDVASSSVVREKFPLLATAAGLIGSVGIRNVATIGGNLCNASPSAECAPALLCLGAETQLAGPGGERTVPLEEFFTGPGATVVGPEELLVEIVVPAVGPGTRGVYLKNSPRGSIDLAIVGVATVATFAPDGTCRGIKISLGAVAPTPMRAKKAEDLLEGKIFDDTLIASAARIAADESRPVDDVRASAGYRREMIEVFARRALKEVRPPGKARL
jgi:CO/xanthine dehydrogenase FAD-binding subunit